jgi:hypothetical protein
VNNKPLFYLLIVFIILNIVDVITTTFILKGESNPLYHLFGTIWVIYILKIVVIWVAWRWYSKNIFPSNFAYYMFIAIILYGSVILGLAMIVNLKGMFNPVALEQAAQLPVEQKIQSYVYVVNIFYLIPVLFSLLCFWIYDKSRQLVTIDKEFWRKKKWWEFW